MSTDAYSLMLAAECGARLCIIQAHQKLEEGDEEAFHKLHQEAREFAVKALEAWRDLNDCHDAAGLHTLQEGTPVCWWNEYL